jgi:hypothetical protein
MASEFEIRFHEAERILEVRYPAKPTLDSYGRYELVVRRQISAIAGQWKCLVDQSSLTVMPPELPLRIAELNAWAKTQGMHRTARVVRESATAQLQASRIIKNSGTGAEAIVATSRDEAWAALVRAA